MFPVPRITADSVLKIQTSTAPANTSSNTPWPLERAAGSAQRVYKRARPPAPDSKDQRNTAAMTSACITSASASSRRRAPSGARNRRRNAPAHAPADVICIR